jgi:hypothetical protein
MRYSALLLGTLMLLATSACKTGQRAHSRAPVAETAAVESHLPASTPYDDIGHGRSEYLEGYQEGYRNGIQGALNPYARVGGVTPRSRGWHDGAFAARISRAMRMTMD